MKEINIKKKLELYDTLYFKADKLFKKYNPCKIKNGKCTCQDNRYNPVNGCCQGCEYLTYKGCSVKALYCKLYICFELVFSDKIVFYPKFTEELYKLKKEAKDNGLLCFRGSRKDTEYCLNEKS